MIDIKIEILEKNSVRIYRMSSLDLQKKPVLWVSSYLVDGLLIDFGHHHARNKFLEKLDLDEVEMCVLSHHHEDHLGACYELIHKYNYPIYATKETAFLAKTKIRIPPERMLTWGLHRPFQAQLLPNFEIIKTSQAEFKIIPSPGHCRNLISFFHIKKRYLFSTDAMISESQNVIFNWENALEMLNTYEQFRKLNPKFIFLENGSVITTNELANLIDYWTEIKSKSKSLYNNGLKTREIVKEIFGKESWLKIATSGDMSRENLVRSLLALPPIYKNRFRRK